MDSEHWEQYYRSGALVTGPAGRDGGYDQELQALWIAQFEPLADGAAILDIGTGNGGVPMIAKLLAADLGCRWRIVGVDKARIDPPAHVPGGAERLAGIEFMGGVAVEALPFEAASFDAVSGQYALEYTDRDRAVDEIARVCRPGARVAFVMHHAGSVLLHNARLSMAQAQFVLMDIKLYRKLKRVVGMVEQPESVVRKAAEDLREAIGALKLAVAKAQGLATTLVLDAALDAVPKLLAVRTGTTPALAEREVDKVEGELRAMVHRLQDLLEHALDDNEAGRVASRFAEAGFDAIERVPQFHGGQNLVGWRLTARRASA